MIKSKTFMDSNTKLLTKFDEKIDNFFKDLEKTYSVKILTTNLLITKFNDVIKSYTYEIEKLENVIRRAANV